jgi:hypothetical protein
MRATEVALTIGLAALAAPRLASAGPTPVLDAHVSTGVDPDATVLGRLMAGGLLVFDELKLAVDAHLSFEGFLRIADDQGVSARSFGLLNLGARYAFGNASFHGPFVAAGAGYGLFTGDPRERKVAGDLATCGGVADDCTFKITQNLSARAGVGWGFAPGEKTTVAVRLDVVYWLFALADGEDQPRGAPYPGDVPRPQDTVTVMVGLEFMRWR